MGKFESYPSADSLNDSDIVLFNQNEITHKVNFVTLVNTIKNKIGITTIDTSPDSNSTNLVTSGGIYNAISVEKTRAQAKEAELERDKANLAQTYTIDNTSDATIDDIDYIPFYDLSSTSKKKITFSGIITKLSNTFLSKSGGTLTGVLKTEHPINQVVSGTGTVAFDEDVVESNTTNTYHHPTKWNFDLSISSPQKGDIISVTIPIINNLQNGVYMSTDNGTTYFPVLINGTNPLQNQFSANTIIMLQFDSNASCNNIYSVNGSTSFVSITNGCWRVVNTTEKALQYQYLDSYGGGATQNLSVSSIVDSSSIQQCCAFKKDNIGYVQIGIALNDGVSTEQDVVLIDDIDFVPCEPISSNTPSSMWGQLWDYTTGKTYPIIIESSTSTTSRVRVYTGEDSGIISGHTLFGSVSCICQ